MRALLEPRHQKQTRLSVRIIAALALVFSSYAASAQIFPQPSTSYGIRPNRGAFDSALYMPTGCGAPTDSTFLFSQGFGNGQKLNLGAFYSDSCGHHIYGWDPSLKGWHRIDSSSGGSSVSDSGFQVLQSPLTGMPIAKYVDGSGHRYILYDTSGTHPGGMATNAGAQKKIDSLNAVISALLSAKFGLTDTGYTHLLASVYTLGKVRDSLAAAYTAGLATKFSLADTGYTKTLASVNTLAKVRDSLAAILAAKMINYGGAPGQLQGTLAGIPAATSYPTGTTYIAQDSAYQYVDTGSGGSRGWKKISGGSGSSTGSVANFLNSQQLGYGPYASKPGTGTAFYYAADSNAWFYVSAGVATNLTPLFNMYIYNQGASGHVALRGSTDSLYARLFRDSIDFHWVQTADSALVGVVQAHDTTSGNALQSKYRSDTARANLYAALGTKIVNAGASVSIKTGIYSARPSASNCQCYYGATDSAKWYYDNGSWITMGGGSSGGASLPSQTGNANLYLQTNGTSALWGDPRQLDTLYVVDDGQSNDYGNADAGYIGDTASDYRVLVADTVTGGFKVAHAGFYPFNTQSPTQYSLSSSFYFARKFARQYGKYVKLIHNGHNGQAIAAWYTSGAPQALLDSLIGRINRFGFPRVDVFIWDQGESDNGTVFSTYTTAYDSLISTLHEQCPAFTFSTSILDVGMPQVALGAPTGYQGQDPNIQTVDYNYNLRDGYVITDSAYINTTTASNPVHFNAKGLQILGERAEWDTWMALPVLPYTRNNPGTLAGAPINPGRVTVRYTEAPGAGAYYDGVNTLNRSTTGRTGFRALSSDSVSTVGGIFLAGPSGSYFSSNQLVAGTETNSDFILSRNFVNYVQLTSTGITMAQKLNYTSSNEAAFTNTTSSSGTGFTFTGDASNFVNLQLGNSASTIPNSLNLYVNNGYKQVWQPSGTRIMDSATFTGSVKSTLEIYGSRGLKIDSLTSNVTLGNHNNIVLFVTGTGIDTCYLPISTGDYMRVYTIRKADTGTTGTVKILLASGSDKIDRAGTSLTLTGSNPIVQVISNGVNGYYTLTPTSSSGTSYYQTAQNSGGSLTQRAKLNATGNIVATDNSGNGSTDLSVVVNTASGATDSVTTTNPSTGAQNRTTLLGLEKNSGLSGIYLPTITVYASTCTINSLDSAVWSQNGNVVTIDGTVNVSPASNGLSTIFYISLPVSSNLNGHNMWGTATSSAQVPTVVGSAGGFINGFTSGGLAQVGFVSGTTSGTNASTWNYHLSYKLE